MAKERIHIRLTEEEFECVKKMHRSRKTCKTLKTRCQILMDMDEGHGKAHTCAQAAHMNGVTLKTVYATLSDFRNGGLDKALVIARAESQNHGRRKADGRTEAQLVAMACGPVPEGHSRWTLRLLEKEGKVRLDVPLSKSTIQKVLKKTNLNRTGQSTGASPKRKTPNS